MHSPDLILLNARIVTMDPVWPTAQALAVSGGRVAALGSDADIRALAGKATRVVDAGGRMVLPGLQDTHIHLQDSGQDYSQNAVLSEARTPDELVDILVAFAAKQATPWITGVGWYSGVFSADNLDRALLDRAVPDRPCMIVASDGHNACLNSLAVAATGLQDAADPQNGHFVRDGQGRATGMVYEEAVAWVEARMPELTDDSFVAGITWGAGLANRHGITGVLDARVKERHVRIYNRMAAEDALTVRVGSTALVNAFDKTSEAVERLSDFRAGAQNDMFKVHSAKFFFDGVVENGTAAMIAPYSDTGLNAPVMFETAQIAEMFTAFDAARFQIHVHCIGDMAVRAALDGMEAARRSNCAWPSDHQIAHIQFIDPADVGRFRPLGVMANVQPLWARHESSVDDVAVPAAGNERSQWMYAFRSLLDTGAGMALSSDWGVSTLNPFEIMETAVTRQPPKAEGSIPPFLPEQRISRIEALRGYTTMAARAAWRSFDTGSLGIGKYADLIVIDRDFLTCDAYDIGDTRVLLTLLGGQEVWRVDDF